MNAKQNDPRRGTAETIWQLIDRLCPDGVPYRKLGEMCETFTGSTPSKKNKAFYGDAYPFYKPGDYSHGMSVADSTEKLSLEGFKCAREVKEGSTLVTCIGSLGKVGYALKQGSCNQQINVIVPAEGIDPRFVFHLCCSHIVQDQISYKASKSVMPILNLGNFNSILIPVPPLDVQREVVRILDKFTELEAELEARLKQYAHYRDCLLSFPQGTAAPRTESEPRLPERLAQMVSRLCPDGVEYRKLGEIGTVSRGGSLQKKDFTETGFPCIHYGQIYTRYGLFADKTLSFVSEECAKKQRKAVKNDIIMAVTSENLEDVCKCVVWLGDEEIAVSGHTAIIHHNQDAKYLAYYFNTAAFFDQKRKIAHGTKVIEVTPDRLLDILIPVPPPEVQREVVRILDKFSELTTSLTAGLPAEIAARRKQYEYYRDKLLSFPRRER